MFKKLTLLLFVALLIPAFVFAQSSGKIAGVVKDKSTGEPLPGVNVVIEGTTMGSATDIDGYYVILNVPVGVYTLKASYIGYKDVKIENVRVSAGITTEINIEMEPTTLELEEAIVVTAERPLVEKNVTQSISLMTAKQIENIPVRGLGNLLALQNSVVVQDGQIHIRGSRSEEVGYYLDGASTLNPLSNTNAIYVIQEAIEEFQVLAGGYTAEFGGANAGIIRTQIRTGTPDYHFSVDFQTDKFAKEGEKFLGTYSYRHHILVGTISGPLVSKKIRFFLAAENNFQGDDEVRFSKGYEFPGVVDMNPNNPNNYVDGTLVGGDTVTIWYPDGFTPHNTTNRYALNGSILFDYLPVRLRISGTWNKRRSYLDGAPWLNIFNNRQVYDDLNTYLLTAKITHVLSPTTFYDVNLSLFNYFLERGDDYFGNDWHKWYDSAAVAQATNGEVIYRDRWRPQYSYLLYGINFSRNGTPSNFYRKLKQNYIGGSFKFTSQVNRYHELKVGLEARQYTVRYFDIAPSVMLYTMPYDSAYAAKYGYPVTYGSIENVPVNVWVLNGGAEGYGYDIYGNEINSDKTYVDDIYTEGPRKPLFGAFYIQDKIEFNDLIINAGLRWDYFDSDDRELRDPSNPKLGPNRFILKSEWKKKPAFSQISPRLGFSFPVSERTVFYLQYGKFVQMPSLNQMYNSTLDLSVQIGVGGFYFINPVGFDLDPVRTTSYEVGFRQQLSNFAALDITGFYRNVKGQVQAQIVQAAPGADIGTYAKLGNGDFAVTKGLELRLTLRRYRRLQAQINYTLTDARGTGSSNISYRSALDRGTPIPKTVFPLDYNQTHRGSIMLDYRFGKNDGPKFLERFGANVLFTFSSGHPYTRVYAPPGGQVDPYSAGVDYMVDTRSREALEPLNASKTPWTFNVDLRLDKTFSVTNKLDVTVYARINNLFNTRNVLNVYQRTGSDRDDGYITDPVYSGQNIQAYGQGYVDLYKAMVIENAGAYRSNLGREIWGQPRQIFFGIKLSY